jgi:hypothetical protein
MWFQAFLRHCYVFLPLLWAALFPDAKIYEICPEVTLRVMPLRIF